MVLDPALDARNAGLWTFMVFYGLDWVATVPPTVALCNQQFGRERGAVGVRLGVRGAQIGAALMAWGAGSIRDATGSYRPAWIIAGIGLPHRRGGDPTHLAGRPRQQVALASDVTARAAESRKHGPSARERSTPQRPTTPGRGRAGGARAATIDSA